MADIQQNILPQTATLRDALTKLNSGIYGIILFVDEAGKLVGIMTDGDVRRAVLNDAQLSEPATLHMNVNFTYGRASNTRQENIQLMSENIRHVPIVDENHTPVDLISWAEIWRIPVMEPSLGGNELSYVSDCITTGWISSKGAYVTRFEELFAEYVGSQYALTTSNGTTALHLAIAAMGIGTGDEVIVPDFTFGASANVIVHAGATPVFVDVTRDSWTIDIEQLEPLITPNTRAIMPVHIYGQPAEMEQIQAFAKTHNLFVIEDAAEALGAEYKEQRVGSIGDAAGFSFFANKIITTGEGGMVTTNDPQLYDKMTLLRAHGMKPSKRYWHEEIGYNYRMTNLQAAVGLAQLERIDQFMQNRHRVIERYTERLSHIDGLILPSNRPWTTNVYWLYSIIIDADVAGIDRDTLADEMEARGIETRPLFHPLHLQPAFARYQQPEQLFPNSQWLADNGLSLPTANDISLDDVDRICDVIDSIVNYKKLLNP